VRSEVGEVWGFLQSNVESRSEGGSCIRIIIIYRIRTSLILTNMTSPCAMAVTLLPIKMHNDLEDWIESIEI